MKNLILGLVIVLTGSMANAACKTNYVCEKLGTKCKRVNVCDKSLDYVQEISASKKNLIPPANPIRVAAGCGSKFIDRTWQNFCY